MKTHNYNRRDFLKISGLSIAALAAPKNLYPFTEKLDKKPNILFIAIDDLRPQLGCYGQSQIISPNIDRIANEGILFEKAYCQVPICMASRASLLTGYRPDHANIYNCKAVDELVPEALTINKHFENNGYKIWASGKIYHHGVDHQKQFGGSWENIETKWSERGYITKEALKIVDEYADEYRKSKNKDPEGRGPAFECADVPDNAYYDGYRTELAIEKLNEFKKSEEPFFMALGYKKPHLPFNAPKKYWDMYDEKDIQLADNPYLPLNYNKYTKYNFTELRNYYGIPKDENLLPDDLARKLIHGYYACVTYTDTQIGKVLGELDKLNLRENTLIVLWGDHGWKLGDHGMWCKHTPFEVDAHVPLIFSFPEKKYAGKRITKLAEFVDIYPTLCAAAGLDLPEHLEGDNLLPIIKNSDADWKDMAITQWPRDPRGNHNKVITGYSLKTGNYRYIEWTRNKTGEILERELYDHSKDPKENENIANYEDNKELVAALSKKLDGGRGWKKFKNKSLPEY